MSAPHGLFVQRPTSTVSRAEIVLACTYVITRILHLYFDAMPLSVFEFVRRVVPNVVLISEFGRDLIEDALDLIAAPLGPVSGKQPCFSAARVGEGVQHVHIDGIPCLLRPRT